MQRSPGIPVGSQTFPPLIGQRTTTIPAPGAGRSTEDYMGGRQYLSDLTDYSGHDAGGLFKSQEGPCIPGSPLPNVG
jgi:hypothetical protein